MARDYLNNLPNSKYNLPNKLPNSNTYGGED